MIFGHRFGILFVIIAVLSTIDYTIADDPSAELEPLWKPFPGPRDEGGCDDDLQNLKDSYTQAIVLAQAAVVAIRNIDEPKPADPKEGQEWERQMKKRQGDVLSAFPNGAFIWKGFDRWETSDYYIGPDEDTDPETNMCYFSNGVQVAAVTLTGQDMLTWCEGTLDGLSPTLEKDAPDANSKIKEGDSMPETMSTVWMHELFHVWADDSVRDEPVARQDDRGTVTRADDNGGYSFAYRFEECANLARLVPDDAKENVDNYQVFATVSDPRHARKPRADGVVRRYG
ncbi:MAG: hypothetical protein Q9208_006276 [Pyrenodesmia sp. 3 TL-2023]